ncbi:MAG: protein BatD [Candidatus Competibacteraceae bacterium]|nr:protein BatD [Candidatus Competibacteraceae bacterium]
MANQYSLYWRGNIGMATPWSWLLFILGLLAAIPSALATVQASFERTTVTQGETVTLLLEIDAQANDAGLDLTPLEQDFTILGRQVNTQLQLINGKPSAQTQWRIELEPKQVGLLQVPSLRIGVEQTQPLTLLVQPPTNADAQQPAADLFIEVQAEPLDPYVQAQVQYTVRLFFAVPLLEGSLAAPSPPNAVVERLGEDVRFQTQRDGRRYQVIERRYALFAQRSGTLTIPALNFEGRIADNNQGSLFSRGRRIKRSSDPMILDVRPRPAASVGPYWLPSAALSLQDVWSQHPPQFRVGEPITRTLRLEARGLSKSQLPELTWPNFDWARFYPDQPVTENSIDGQWLMSRREQSIALVPTRAGRFTFPEVQLDWWDTQQDKPRTAVLPALDIEVLPALNPGQPPVPVQSDTQLLEQQPDQTEYKRTTADAFWPSVAMSLLLAWLVTLYAWWRSNKNRRVSEPARQTVDSIPTNARAAKRAVQHACAANDPVATAQALLAWASALWPNQPARHLGALAARLDPQAGALVRGLDRVLYAPTPTTWDGQSLWQVVQRGLPLQRPKSEIQSALAPLYPERR